MFARWMPPAAAAVLGFVLLAPAQAGPVTARSMSEYGPLTGYVQFSTTPGTIQPHGTINAAPACRVVRRLLCTMGDGSCGTGGVRKICHWSEKSVQIGRALYCDRWVCS